MLRKILRELVLIRKELEVIKKELQAINESVKYNQKRDGMEKEESGVGITTYRPLSADEVPKHDFRV